MPEENPSQTDAELRARLAKLSGALKERRPAPSSASGPVGPKPADSTGAAMSMGLRAGSEFVAAILVGAGIGFALDWALHTKPLFIILFFLLGVAAGVWNVIRATSPKSSR